MYIFVAMYVYMSASSFCCFHCDPPEQHFHVGDTQVAYAAAHSTCCWNSVACLGHGRTAHIQKYILAYIYVYTCMYVHVFACKYVATYFCSNEEVKSCIDHAMRTPTRSHTHAKR